MFQNCMKVLSNFMITILLLSILPMSHSQTNFSSEFRALMDFKALNAANSTTSQGWQSIAGSDNCKPIPWKGLNCWSSGLVRWVRLRDANLTGNISSSLGGLSALTRLDLRNNQLGGGIPADLLRPLVHLKKLLLSGNKLVGSLPETIGNMTQLEELGLRDNDLKGTIPSGLFAGLTHLGIVDLSNNQLTGPIPQTLTSISSLNTLLLWGNKLSGPVPSSLARSTSLHTVDLSGNSFRGPLPLNWTASNLTSLILSGNQLQGPIPLSMLNLSSLVSLNLANNNFTGTVPDFAACRFGNSAFTGNPNLAVETCESSSSDSTILSPSPAPRPEEIPAEPGITLRAPGPLSAVQEPSGPFAIEAVQSSETDSDTRPKSRVLLILVVVAANIGMIVIAAAVITLLYVVCKQRPQVEPPWPQANEINSKDSLDQQHRVSTNAYSTSRTPPDSARTSDFRASAFSEAPSSEFEKSSVFQSGTFRNDQPELHLFQDGTFTR